MKTLQQISDEITPWAAKNFKVHKPHIGILEEIGEMAHVILKAHQKIRGYDDPVKRKRELIDGIADVAIYGLHYIGIHKLAAPISLDNLSDLSENTLLSNLSYAAGAILSGDRNLSRNNLPILFNNLNTLAIRENVNFLALVNDTWNKVSQRDWTANPVDAHEKAEQTQQ
jgi:hypothetical protein